MKKTITMAAMALAVSAMATSAFAAEPALQTTAVPIKLIATQPLQAPQELSFQEFAKGKGVTVDELLAQMEEDGSLADLAKLKSLSLEQMKDYLKTDGKVIEAVRTLTVLSEDKTDGEAKALPAAGKTIGMKMKIMKPAESVKEGSADEATTITTAVPLSKTVTIAADDARPFTDVVKVLPLETAAKTDASVQDAEKGMLKIIRTVPATKVDGSAAENGQMAELVPADQLEVVKMTAITVNLSLEDVAQSQGLTVDELLAQMEEGGTLAEVAKSKDMTVDEAIEYLKSDAAFSKAAVAIPAVAKK